MICLSHVACIWKMWIIPLIPLCLGKVVRSSNSWFLAEMNTIHCCMLLNWQAKCKSALPVLPFLSRVHLRVRHCIESFISPSFRPSARPSVLPSVPSCLESRSRCHLCSPVSELKWDLSEGMEDPKIPDLGFGVHCVSSVKYLAWRLKNEDAHFTGWVQMLSGVTKPT